MIDLPIQLVNIKKAEEVFQQLRKEEGLKIGTLSFIAAVKIDSEVQIECYPVSIEGFIKKCLTKEKVKDIIDKYSTQLNDISESNFEVESELIGGKYISFPVSKLDSEEIFELVHKPGEIWLVDIWATWCGPCQPAMAHNQEMLEHHPEWKDKVRILGISLDKGKQEVKKRVEEKKWTLVEHYFAVGDWKSKAAQSYNVHGIPFVCLVNAEGLVVKMGHPMECDLENSINSLLSGKNLLEEPIVAEAKKEEKKKMPSYEDCFNSIKATIEKYKAVAQKYALIFILINKTDVLKDEPSLKCRISFKKELPKRLEPEITKELEKVFNELKDIVKIENKMQFIETFVVERGKECSLCHKTLTIDAPQYKCRECDYSICYTCIADDKHPHIMYLIRKDANLEVFYGPGKDKTKPGDDSKIHQGVRCDCCRGTVEGIRWKCANCGDVDVCQKCFDKVWNGKSDDNKSEYETAAKVDHDIDHHVLLRIVKNRSMAN